MDRLSPVRCVPPPSAARSPPRMPGLPSVRSGLSAVLLLAQLVPAQGNSPTAASTLRSTLSECEAKFGTEAIELAGVLEELAQVVADQGDLVDAVARLDRARAIRQKHLGPKHASLLKTCYQLGAKCHMNKDYEKAEGAYEQALAIAESGDVLDPASLAMLLNNYGGLHFDRGAYDKAEPLLRRCLAIHLQLGGPDHPSVASDRASLAELLRRTHRSAEAAAMEAGDSKVSIPRETLPVAERQRSGVPVWVFGAAAALIGALVHRLTRGPRPSVDKQKASNVGDGAS